MEKGTVKQQRVHISAPPEVVYNLVSDVTRMGEWSPECVDCEWLDGATGAAVGARFRGKNKNGMVRWSNKPRVVVAESGSQFAFVVPDLLGKDSTKWTYRFEPSGDGTDVIESFEVLATIPLYVRLGQKFMMGSKDRGAELEANMRLTLERIKSSVEAPRP